MTGEGKTPWELQEGWYLMSDADLELELARFRSGDRDLPPSNALPLGTQQALLYRNAGNRPDHRGRTLRLVLHVGDASELKSLERQRLLFEPDFHDAPNWRVAGSRLVNIVPLRRPPRAPRPAEPWWEQEEVAALEQEWQESGTVGGVRVPSEYRSFVFKTVLGLRLAGKEITASSIADSVQRWLPPEDALRIRVALEQANPDG
jgi:hypothetical protein